MRRIDDIFFSVYGSMTLLYDVLSAGKDSEGIEGMGENVITFALIFGLMTHEIFGGDPAAERWLVLYVLGA